MEIEDKREKTQLQVIIDSAIAQKKKDAADKSMIFLLLMCCAYCLGYAILLGVLTFD